ncbi:MAG: hypothetical protein JWO46_3249 [Nocardioidaceae bacterium]|nr:hypothetical protein [Nocardioidaceae bacterium]
MPDNPDPFRLPAALAHRARRRVLLHRRPIAVLLLALGVLAGLQAVRPPAAATVGLVVAAHDLPAGARLSAADLTLRGMPPDAVPDGAARSLAHVGGRTLAAPVRRGEVITDVRSLGPALVARYPGRVATPVRLADPDVAAVLRPGDHVQVVAADAESATGEAGGRVLGSGIVLTLPRASDSDPTSGTTGLPGRLVLLAVTDSDAAAVAAAAASLVVTVLLTP